MLFLLICTEGVVSEPEYLKAFIQIIRGQLPQSGENAVDILTVPLGGNHGHTKLVEAAEEQIAILESDKNALIHYAESTDTKEKWLVCDYDELGDLGISLEEFYESCTDAGYTLIMNKPNFEYFILALLAGWEVAENSNVNDLVSEINKHIDRLNNKNKTEKQFTDSMLIPHYSKKTRIAQEIFGKLLHLNPELIWRLEENEDTSGNFSDMPILLRRLKEIYGLDR